MQPFIIHALPRSRTAWLAEFLTYKDCRCAHEQAIFLRSIDDIKRLFSLPNTGCVETASAQAWRIIQHHVPNIKMVVIKRPIDDVMQSMVNIDLHGYAAYDIPRLRKVMEYGNRMLDEVSEQPGVLTIDFSELDTAEGCAKVFEFCLPHEFDPGWWSYMQAINVQADVIGTIRYYHENKPAIEGFKKIMWREMRALARQGIISKHQGNQSAIH